MGKNRKWQRVSVRDFNARKSTNSKESDLSKEEFDEYFLEAVKICSFLVFQKLLESKELDFETYYQDIANLVITVNSEYDMELGVLRIAEKISNEMNLRMKYK